MIEKTKPKILGIAAWSGTGKTTLLKQALPLLRARGLRVAVIKHAHHSFDIDKPGKDSYELRKAGAERVLLASKHRRALVTEHVHGREPALAELLSEVGGGDVDLILVEGFKRAPIPKIELYRAATGKKLLSENDPDIIAIAAAGPPPSTDLPLLDLNNPQQVAEFIFAWLGGRGEGEGGG